jgi:hypothetical protein
MGDERQAIPRKILTDTYVYGKGGTAPDYSPFSIRRLEINGVVVYGEISFQRTTIQNYKSFWVLDVDKKKY